MEGNFQKYTNEKTDALSTPYDYASIMHYPNAAFSKNGLPTIVPLQPNVQIGQRVALSTTDIREVQLFYGCVDNTARISTINSTNTTGMFNGHISLIMSIEACLSRTHFTKLF